jgi:hypothetical protein
MSDKYGSHKLYINIEDSSAKRDIEKYLEHLEAEGTIDAFLEKAKLDSKEVEIEHEKYTIRHKSMGGYEISDGK